MIYSCLVDIHLFDVVAYPALSIGKIIVVNIAVARVVFGRICKTVVFLGDLVHIEKALFKACSEKNENGWEIRSYILGQANGELTVLKLLDCAENRLIA